MCQNPADYITSDPEVVYNCDSISGICTVGCGNGASPNVETVTCQYGSGLSRSGSSGSTSWRVDGQGKTFNKHVTNTLMRKVSKNEKQAKKAQKKNGKAEKKQKKGTAEKTVEIFVPKFVSTGKSKKLFFDDFYTLP